MTQHALSSDPYPPPSPRAPELEISYRLPFWILNIFNTLNDCTDKTREFVEGNTQQGGLHYADVFYIAGATIWDKEAIRDKIYTSSERKKDPSILKDVVELNLATEISPNGFEQGPRSKGALDLFSPHRAPKIEHHIFNGYIIVWGDRPRDFSLPARCWLRLPDGGGYPVIVGGSASCSYSTLKPRSGYTVPDIRSTVKTTSTTTI